MKGRVSVTQHRRVSSVLAATLGLSALGAASIALAQPAAAGATPPTPTHLQLAQRTASSVNLTWDWTAGAGAYELSYGGTTLRLDHTYPSYSGALPGADLSPGHSYDLQVRAIDAAGNRSATPATLVFETTPPAAPTGTRVTGLTASGSADQITWDAAAANGGTIRRYDVFVDGRLAGGTQSTSASIYALYAANCWRPAPGTAQVQIRATDSSLNKGPLSAPLTVVFK